MAKESSKSLMKYFVLLMRNHQAKTRLIAGNPLEP